MRKLLFSLLAGLLLVSGFAIAQSVINFREAGGERWGIGGSLDIVSGGEIDIESGGLFKIVGTTMTSSAAELIAVDITTAGTVEASKAVVVDSSKDISAFRDMDVVNLDAGSSGTAGTMDVFPSTASSGKLALTAADNAGDTTTTIVNASQAAARTYTIPDAGASTASFMMTEGAQTVVGAQTYSGANTHNNDVTISTITSGGDAGARNEFIGLPKLRMVSYGTGTNGSTETVALFSDTPASQCATNNQTAANDNTIVRAGTNSLKITFASTPTAGDGADCTFAGGADDFESNESIGFWFRTDTALNAGDVYLELDDDTASPDTTYDLPAVATVDQWTWIELDISACGGGDCNVVDAAKLIIDAGGASTLSAGGNIWFDLMYKWDSTDEDAIGQNIVQDGVLGVMQMITATANDRTPMLEIQDTDYLVHYQTGNDFLVWMTDQSGKSLWGMVAIQ